MNGLWRRDRLSSHRSPKAARLWPTAPSSPDRPGLSGSSWQLIAASTHILLFGLSGLFQLLLHNTGGEMAAVCIKLSRMLSPLVGCLRIPGIRHSPDGPRWRLQRRLTHEADLSGRVSVCEPSVERQHETAWGSACTPLFRLSPWTSLPLARGGHSRWGGGVLPRSRSMIRFLSSIPSLVADAVRL